MDVFEVEKPSNVSFGTTQDRQIFPTHVPPTRFGNELNPITGVPQVGPGKYNVEEMTNLIHQFNARPKSNKGYAARLAPRFIDWIDIVTPAPTEYQRNCCDPRISSPAYRPFNVAAERFQVSKRVLNDVTPGPGTYEQSYVPGCRRVQYHQSFGGNPINLPCIKLHSTIDRNTDKLKTTKEEKRYHRKLAYLKLYYS